MYPGGRLRCLRKRRNGRDIMNTRKTTDDASVRLNAALKLGSVLARKSILKHKQEYVNRHRNQWKTMREDALYAVENDKLYQHPLFRVWHGMCDRCLNPEHQSYRRYGGRGIIICEAWIDNYRMFIQWGIDNGWKPGLQLDRIDNDKGYSPDNCRFVTPKENRNNC